MDMDYELYIKQRPSAEPETRVQVTVVRTGAEDMCPTANVTVTWK